MDSERRGARTRGILVALVAAALSCSALAQAQVKPQASAAGALFQEAVALAKQGKYSEAITKFRASYALDPARGTLLGLGMAEEAGGLLASAYGHFQEYLDQGRDTADPKREKAAKDALARLATRVPKVTFVIKRPVPAGLSLELDGAALPASALGNALPVDPGTHVMHVQAPSFKSVDEKFTAVEGKSSRIELQLIQDSGGSGSDDSAGATGSATLQPSGGWSTLRTTGLIVGGVGLVLAAGGTYFWIKSGNTHDDLDSACPNRRCPASLQDKAEEGETQDLLGRVGLIAGGVGVAVGVSLFVLGGKGNRSDPTAARLLVTPRWIGIAGAL